MYPNMTQFLPFYMDNGNFYQNDKTFMITGSNIAFLCAFLNSSLFKQVFKDNFPKLGDKGRELRKIFFDKIPIINVTEPVEKEFEDLVSDIQNEYSTKKAQRINNRIFELYGLTSKEVEFIDCSDVE